MIQKIVHALLAMGFAFAVYRQYRFNQAALEYLAAHDIHLAAHDNHLAELSKIVQLLSEKR